MFCTINVLKRGYIFHSSIGRKDLVIESLKKTISTEMDAVIAAAEQVGIVKFPTSTRKAVIGEMKKLAYDTIGIGA